MGWEAAEWYEVIRPWRISSACTNKGPHAAFSSPISSEGKPWNILFCAPDDWLTPRSDRNELSLKPCRAGQKWFRGGTFSEVTACASLSGGCSASRRAPVTLLSTRPGRAEPAGRPRHSHPCYVSIFAAAAACSCSNSLERPGFRRRVATAVSRCRPLSSHVFANLDAMVRRLLRKGNGRRFSRPTAA